MRALLRVVLLCAVLVGASLTLAAQPAESGWLDVFAVPGLSAEAYATLPDGGGFAVGGAFTHADGRDVGGIARWTGTAWEGLGGGLRLRPDPDFQVQPVATVRAPARTPDGRIWAAGTFDEAVQPDGSALPVRNVAVWTGAAWALLGRGTNGEVSSLAALTDGSVVVAGGFSEAVQADGTALASPVLARWTETGGWEAIGAPIGFFGPTPASLEPDGDGMLVSGWFDRIREADGTERPARGVARWSPGGWETFGGAAPTLGPSIVGDVARWDGGIAVSGTFDAVAGPDGVAVPANGAAWWDGAAWRALGAQPRSSFGALADANGVLVAVGSVGDGPGTVRWWNGTVWQPIADDPTGAAQILPADGRLYLTGAWVQHPDRQQRGLAALGLAGLVADEPRPSPAANLPLSVVPNPAAGRAAVAFTLDRAARVRVSVVDALGREVLLVLDAERAAGAHRADVDVRRLPPGVYAVRVQGPGAARARTFTVVR